MLRMEIALILILVFVAYVYFSAGRKYSLLHKTFSVLLNVSCIVFSSARWFWRYICFTSISLFWWRMRQESGPADGSTG